MTHTYLAYAKFNLYLAVLGKRADGYHEVDTVLQNVDLCDRLEFTPADREVLEVRADAADVPDGESNLVWRALALLREFRAVEQGMRVRIAKRIPARAGLGGGSSDAACALCAANRIWRLGLTVVELESLAARLGSDVPFFVRGGTQRCRGRGERVTPLPDLPECDWVIIKPDSDLATSEVYARVTPRLTTPRVKSRIMLDALAKREATRVVAELFNDLEAAAEELLPETAQVKARMGQLGLTGIVMAGSGSAWVGHSPDAAARRRAVAEGSRKGWQVFLVRTQARGWSEAKNGGPKRRSTGM